MSLNKKVYVVQQNIDCIRTNCGKCVLPHKYKIRCHVILEAARHILRERERERVCVCVCVWKNVSTRSSHSASVQNIWTTSLLRVSDGVTSVCRSSATTPYLCSPCPIPRIIMTFLICKQSYRSYHTQMNKFYNITCLFHQKLFHMFLVRSHSMLHSMLHTRILQSMVVSTTQKLTIHC